MAKMLERVLNYLNNWFVLQDGIQAGDYTISSGGLSPADLQLGQYYRITGSVFNDGLHRHPANDLIDEAFTGAVWPLSVPRDVVDIAEEAEAWQTKFGDKAASPFTSESFGGYSYSKESGDASAKSWEEAFKARLAPYRKLCALYGAPASKPQTPPLPPYLHNNPWR